MLRFSLFGFPILVHWIFWLNAALLGGAISAGNSPEEMMRLAGWVVVVFVSIIIHELGHAFCMRHYGDQRVGIMLFAFGGLAQGSRQLTRRENFFVSAAGPFVQISAAVVLWWVSDFWRPEHWLARYMMTSFIFSSIFWAVLNLLPIVPLDGGHISMTLFGPRRRRMALYLSLVCAVGMAVLAGLNTAIFAALFFGLMAFNNWKELRGESQVPWMAGR